MTTQVRFRRGTTNDHNVFVGAPQEITINIDTNRPHVHDGTEPGGFPLAKLADLTAAETTLTNAINAEEAARIAADTTEAAARSAADTALETLLSNSANINFDPAGTVLLSTTVSAAIKEVLNTLQSNLDAAVPNGIIAMWKGTTLTIPEGWALCDGLNGTPDLRDKFIIGVGAANTYAATGGSRDAIVPAHSHTASSAAAGGHGHTMTVGSAGDHTHTANHSHTASSNSTGAHTHTASTGSAGDHTHATNIGHGYTTVTGISYEVPVDKANIMINTASAGAHTHSVTVNSAGSHSHTITVNSATVTTSIAGAHTHTVTAAAVADHSHTVTVNSTGVSVTDANLPPYYALAYIMKL